MTIQDEMVKVSSGRSIARPADKSLRVCNVSMTLRGGEIEADKSWAFNGGGVEI